MRRISAKTKLRDKGFLLGCFVEIGAPEVVEILGISGFDFVVIDCEHAAFSGETVGNLIRAAQAVDVAPLVRVRENHPGHVLEALDLGAVGLHIPRIGSREDAVGAVAATMFPPRGVRGLNPFVRAAAYGAEPLAAFRQTADDDTLVVLHVEAEESMEQVEELLAVPGIDVAFLGPYDLSQTMGIPGEVTHPRVQEAMRRMVEAAKPHQVAVGCFANTPEQAKLWLEAGVTYLTYSVDSVLLASHSRKIQKQIAKLRGTDD